MPKILMVSKPVGPPWDDASKNLVRDIVTNCTDFRFHVMTAPPQEFKTKNSRPVHVYSPQDGFGLTLYDKIKLFVRLLQPDELGLYHFFFTPTPANSKASRFALKIKIFQKSIHTICSLPEDLQNIKQLMFADEIVTVSEHGCNQLKKAGVENVRLIYPAVKEYEPLTEEKTAETREKFSLPTDKTLVLFAGDLEFSNATDTLLEALPEILKNENVALVFCNRIKTGLANQKLNALKKQILKNQNSDRVFFIEPSDDFISLLAACDIQLMHPNSLYGKMDIPLVILEGMMLNTVSIMSNLPSLLEIAEDEKSAIYINPSDPAQLADAVTKLVDDKEKLSELKINGRELVKTRFNMETLKKEYSKLYQEFD